MSGGRDWMMSEVRRLNELRAQRVRVVDIARELGRTEDAIYGFLRYVPATRDTPASKKPIDLQVSR